uniref:Core-binding (CB) domain-containing protein n=1 Tax=Cupriavidus metallidurans (strain ATCC 43123 / DSM 2839 / NBRC 102507 / CH34) TaxID=266264 RepID=A0AAI8V0H1_CUPMC|nr:hypothetical protein [Cupriavidus metallidurans CH34]
MHRPTPRECWVGPPRPHTSPDWRPFVDNLSARSVAHALTVLSALFRWLVEQRYVLANPLAGIKVRSNQRAMAVEITHAFTDGDGCWCAPSPTASSGRTAGKPRPHSGFASCWISDTRRDCGSANWPMPRCVISTSTPRAITGCTWSAKVASPLGLH